MVEAFSGTWVVDNSKSDSIEPMLAKLGVPWAARKLAINVETTQQIEVSSKSSLTITNSSDVGCSRESHTINAAAPRVVKTKDGKRAETTCSWEVGADYPLCIVARLPQGTTTDQRRISSPDTFVQRLRYVPSTGEAVTMERTWVRMGAPSTSLPSQDPLEWLLLSLVLLACTMAYFAASALSLHWALSAVVAALALGAYLMARAQVQTGELYQTLRGESPESTSPGVLNQSDGPSASASASGGRRPQRPLPERMVVHVVRVRIIEDLFAQFKIRVQYGGAEWSVWRRYSQFDALRAALVKSMPDAPLPALPAKRFLRSNLENSFLERRRAGLDTFVGELMAGPLGNKIADRGEVKRFFGLDSSRTKKALAKSVKGPMAVDPKQGAAPAEAPLSSPPAFDETTPDSLDALKEGLGVLHKAVSLGTSEGDGWKLHGIKSGVHCFLKQSSEGFTFTKGVGTIDAPAWAVFALLSDPNRKHEYDDLFKAETPVASYDPAVLSRELGLDVRQSTVKRSEFKSPFPMAIGARDIVLIAATCVEPSGKLTLPIRSVEMGPPSGPYIRAECLGGGIVIDPEGEDRCTVSVVQCLDPMGAIPQFVVNKVAPQRCLMVAALAKALSNGKWGERPALIA